jgi:signal transduction histidine kinase
MRIKWLKKFIHSIFTKLLVIIVLTGICINLVVVGFFGAYRSMVGKPFHKNIEQYVNYILADLGSPPTLERARKIAAQSVFQIHYQSPQRSWSTSNNPLTIHQQRFHVWNISPRIKYVRHHGRSLLVVDHEPGTMIFEWTKNFNWDRKLAILLMVMFGLMGLILTGAYLSIRWILRPVKWLNRGVREVSKGNLEHRVPLKRSDELKDLAAAFNAMTERIREMLHAKERLLLDVSHELRSPVTRMKVALEFLPQSQAKKNIKTDVAEMETMIAEILETARKHHHSGQLNKQRMSLGNLLREILPEFEQTAPGIQKSIDLSSVAPINVDSDQIKTVLKNVFRNALKFSEESSQPVNVRLKSRPPYMILQVEDHGIGIPEEELPFIFEPFYRVDKSRSKRTGGYGLGLSLCKTIMEAHGGKIEIASRMGEGTIVSLFFPESKLEDLSGR